MISDIAKKALEQTIQDIRRKQLDPLKSQLSKVMDEYLDAKRRHESLQKQVDLWQNRITNLQNDINNN